MSISLFDKRDRPCGVTCSDTAEAVRLLRSVAKAEYAADAGGSVVARRWRKNAACNEARAAKNAGGDDVLPGQMTIPGAGLVSPVPHIVPAPKKARKK